MQMDLPPALPSLPVSSFSPPGCPHPSASPPAIRTAKRRRGPGEQPIARQECSTEATSGAEVAGVREPTGLRRSQRRRVPEAQVAERRLVSETAARQDSNDKRAEVETNEGDEGEGDPTDVEADFEETTAMAMKDRMVQRHPLVGCMDMDAENAHRIATAIARILQQTSGRFFKRPSAWIRTALSNWATGARSARGASVSTTPCTLVSDPWSGKGNMEKGS
jgi:hypothetical protein